MLILLSFLSEIHFVTTIDEKSVSKLEDENRDLTAQIQAQKKQIEKLKTDIQNQSCQVLDMDWIWEFNLGQLCIQRTAILDYFIRGKDEPILWKDRPEDNKTGDKRALGVLKVGYDAKIGIDLKQVLASTDDSQKIVRYWAPEPEPTGIKELKSDWLIKTRLDYSKGDKIDLLRRRDWRWVDEETKNTPLPIWETKKTEMYEQASASETLENRLTQLLSAESDRRIKSLLSMRWPGYQIIPATKKELKAPARLMEVFQSLRQEAYSAKTLEQSNDIIIQEQT
ncbi:MAG: hypothetical protein GX811_03925 [Lentisphaerae bacterium]|nr:hypothetical protein [Lentisphaerota bacterium]